MKSAHPRDPDDRYQEQFIYTFRQQLIEHMVPRFLLLKRAFFDDLVIKRVLVGALTLPRGFWRGACNSLSYANSLIDRDRNDDSHSHGTC